MPFITQCTCGSGKFLVVAEKTYEAVVDGNGTLQCREESEYVKEIRCAKCERAYRLEDFKEIDY